MSLPQPLGKGTVDLPPPQRPLQVRVRMTPWGRVGGAAGAYGRSRLGVGGGEEATVSLCLPSEGKGNQS